MADAKISQLTAATLPLAGTEVLPLVQSGTTKKVATDDLTVKNLRSNATSGILQVAGPGAAATRTMTTPDANFTVARTDASQSFSGTQTFAQTVQLNTAANDSGKYGRKTYITQSSVDNPVVNLATFGAASGQNLMAKVTVYHAASAGGAISVGYARYGNTGTSTVVAMALEANLGITNVGTLAFSGDVLQYTANRVNNFDWYTIVVEIGGGAAVSNF
jgi:hypothetical protein